MSQLPDHAFEKTPGSLMMRDVAESDLAIFFANEQDPQANQMAAFTAKNPADHAAFLAHWTRILADTSVLIQTVLYEGQVAGSVLSYIDEGHPEVSYWLGREFWGKGIATRVLRAFLQVQTARPMYARAARDNLASLRVLEKCGFSVVSESKGFANARGQEIDELLLVLH